ncbi:MAG: hypothetical protein AB1646_18435 [Thermodesulfobacteriota bacterium]
MSVAEIWNSAINSGIEDDIGKMPVTILEDQDKLKSWMMERWHEQGERFSVFEPADQPAPSVWELQLPEPDHPGREHPDSLKQWPRLYDTRDFLRARYGKHVVLQGASLSFDCLVPNFQKRTTEVWGQDAHGDPGAFPVKDRHEWYEGAIRMGIFGWQVRFSCRRCRVNGTGVSCTSGIPTG